MTSGYVVIVLAPDGSFRVASDAGRVQVFALASSAAALARGMHEHGATVVGVLRRSAADLATLLVENGVTDEARVEVVEASTLGAEDLGGWLDELAERAAKGIA